MTGMDIALLAAGLIALLGAVLAVTSRVLTHAVAMGVVAHLGLAACLLLLGADAVSAVFLLLGAISGVVLLLVALTVTRAPLEKHDDLDVSWARRSGAFVTGLAAAALLGVALVETVGWHPVPVARPGAEALARGLFTTWWWAFLLAALLAVVAVLAALHLAAEGDDE